MLIPLFPLSSIVLPDGILPLRLFEPRYLTMVTNCFKTDSGFGVCLIQDGSDSGAPALPFPLGTLVNIVDFDQGTDGLLHITAKGEQEFTLQDFHTEPDGLLMGEVTLVERPEPAAVSCELDDDVRVLSDKLGLILDHLEPHINFAERRLDDPEWVCNRLLELLPVDANTRYDLLRSIDCEQRLAALHELDFRVSAE